MSYLVAPFRKREREREARATDNLRLVRKMIGKAVFSVKLFVSYIFGPDFHGNLILFCPLTPNLMEQYRVDHQDYNREFKYSSLDKTVDITIGPQCILYGVGEMSYLCSSMMQLLITKFHIRC